ncbi:MAG: peptide chain release factor 1 [bacterium]|nr:peptide chain release factor 1 [bacterium]
MRGLKELKAEFNALTDELANPELISDWEKFQDISRRRGKLEKVIKKAEEIEGLKLQIEENQQILSSQESAELSSLAEQETLSVQSQLKKTEKELATLLRGSEEDLPSALVLEVRPGTGGEEASLFARNLFDMYLKFAESQKWRTSVLNLEDTESGGIKQASAEIKGDDAFLLLRHEAGVHRVQRIPETEKVGRIHTSTASVAILAKPKEKQIEIKPDDLRIDTYRSSGKGGQNVNKRETAIRITHIPTGLVVTSQTQRSQAQNKENAMSLLSARLLQSQRETAHEGAASTRKAQIGSAERAEKIRTYNFPQDRITDHRIQESWHGIERVLSGDLLEITETLAEKLN